MRKNDETFLARWINKELTDEELKNFKSKKEYITYKRIISITNTFKAPKYDLEKAFEKVKNVKNKQEVKTIKPKWYIGIAASVIILLGLFILLNNFNTDEYSTDYGKKLAFELPDGSKVLLNSKSKITFDKKTWENNRTLKLDGEAFFDVEKGKKFTVQTNQGNISVLGTEFNVNATKNFLKVLCYEGKVEVKDIINNNKAILNPTEGYQNTNENNPIKLKSTSTKPEWINNKSVFKSVPLRIVFETLEKQYNLTIDYKNIDEKILFTGSFPNNNKEIALKSVLKSLNLNYSINKNNIILVD